MKFTDCIQLYSEESGSPREKLRQRDFVGRAVQCNQSSSSEVRFMLTPVSSLQTAIESIEALSEEEQDMVFDLIQRRRICLAPQRYCSKRCRYDDRR